MKSTRHLVGIGTVEFDLNAEGLVGIPDHVLPLVLAAGSPCEWEQLAMKLVVGCQRPLAFRHLGALGLEELVPELLGLGLLAVDPLAFVPVALDGPGINIGPFRCVDSGVFDVRHKCGWDRLYLCRYGGGSGRKWGADHCLDRRQVRKNAL